MKSMASKGHICSVAWEEYNLQKASEFAVPIRYMCTFFPLFLISKSTYDIAKGEKSSVDVNTWWYEA